MYIETKFKIIVLFLIGYSLTSYSALNEGITNIHYDSLKFLRSVYLEENDAVILTKVTNVSTNSSSSQLLVSDAEGKMLILYDSQTGKIIKSFEIGLNFSDSLAIKGKYWSNEYKYVTKDKIRDTSGNPLGEDYLKWRLSNEIINGIFYNDKEIWATAYIKCFAVPVDTSEKDKGIRGGLATGLIRFNLVDGTSCYHPLEQIYYAFPHPYFFVIDKFNNDVIILTKNFPAFWNGHYDSLWILGSYSLDGKLKDLITTLPEEYTSTKLGYKMLYEPRFCFNRSNELLCIFPYVEYVYNLTKRERFKLQSLPNSNKKYLDSLVIEPDLYKEFLKRYFYFLPITIDDIYTKTNDNIVVTLFHVFQHSDSTITRERIIQEYNQKGELLKQFRFNNIEGNTYIGFIYYDKNRDEYLIFRNSKSIGWQIEFYKNIE